MSMGRDDLIRLALTPRPDLSVPIDLADSISRAVEASPQRGPSLAQRLRLPQVLSGPIIAGRPAAAWLAIVLLLGLAITAIVGIAVQRDQSFPAQIANYHGDPAQDGVMPGPAPQGRPSILWDEQLDGPMDNLSVPLVRDGIAYFVDTRGTVVARDAVTGAEVWTTGLPGRGAHAPALVGDLLIIATEAGTVVGLDVATGVERWRRDTRVSVTAPLAASDGRVVLGSTTGGLVVLSALDGEELYRLDTEGPIQRSPAIADGRAYIAADTGVVTAFDLEDGTIAWRTDLAADDPEPFNSPEALTPVFADGVIYLTRGPFDTIAPHEVVALDARTGAVRWRWASPNTDRIFVAAVTDDTVYTVGEDRVVRALNLDGSHVRTLMTAAAPFGSLATVVDDTLFLATTDGIVRAIDRATGEEQWQVQVPGSPTMPVVVDGRVVVGTDIGRAVSIGTSTGS